MIKWSFKIRRCAHLVRTPDIPDGNDAFVYCMNAIVKGKIKKMLVGCYRVPCCEFQ